MLWKKEGRDGGFITLGAIWPCRDGAPLNIILASSGNDPPRMLSCLKTSQCFFTMLLICLCWVEKDVIIAHLNFSSGSFFGFTSSKVFLSIFMALWISKSRLALSYPLSINFCLRTPACVINNSVSVQFLRSLRNWLRGTALNQDLWWQLVVGIKPLRSVGLK